MKDYVAVRFSHLLGFAGVGAIVRGERYLHTLLDTSSWSDHLFIPYVERVRGSLGIGTELHEPPAALLDEKGRPRGTVLPAMRFPSWMRCLRCGLLHWRWWEKPHNQVLGPRCSDASCGGALEQHPWVLIDKAGRMDDIPWHWLLHGQGPCTEDRSSAYLVLIDGAEDPKLSGRWEVRCNRCRCPGMGVYPQDIKHRVRPQREQPWRNGLLPKDGAPSDVEVIDVNDPRLYSAPWVSAMVIPPESRIRRGTVVDRIYCNRQWRQQLDVAKTALQKRQLTLQLALSLKCTAQEIECALADIHRGYPLYGQTFTPGQLLQQEYTALTTPIPELHEDEDLVTIERTRDWRFAVRPDGFAGSALGLIDRIVEIPRLREVRIFKGFQRLGGPLVPPDITGQANWLPAIDLFGEGIFVTLDLSAVEAWEEEDTVRRRASLLDIRYQQTAPPESQRQWLPSGRVSPRFVLLHTLSHLLIRQLEVKCGYPAASLKERIYSGTGMAAVLIYVTVADTAGSLGGLSELARPERFAPILSAALSAAQWCSLDPVCSEHEGQGPGLLNLAACHGCSLVPETACIIGNQLLDRTMVKGDLAGQVRAPWSFLSFGNVAP